VLDVENGLLASVRTGTDFRVGRRFVRHEVLVKGVEDTVCLDRRKAARRIVNEKNCRMQTIYEEVIGAGDIMRLTKHNMEVYVVLD